MRKRKGGESTDPRLALIEESRGKPLGKALRALVLRQLQYADEHAEGARREFTVPDQTEPSVIFRPARPACRRGERDG